MYIQSQVIEKRSNYVAEIIDPVVQDLDYPEFEAMLRQYPLDLWGFRPIRTLCQMYNKPSI